MDTFNAGDFAGDLTGIVPLNARVHEAAQLNDAIAGYDLYSIEFIISTRCQSFPDALCRAAIFHMLVRELIVPRRSCAIALTLLARAPIARMTGTAGHINHQQWSATAGDYGQGRQRGSLQTRLNARRAHLVPF